MERVLASGVMTVDLERVAQRARRHVGIAMGVVDGGGLACSGFGVIGPTGDVPDGATSFQIGSVTKLFTAVLLADAVDRGEVALDQPITSVFPQAASHPRGRTIRFVDLATHTAGLPRLPPGLARQAWRHRDDPYAGFTLEQLETALARPPRRPPGGRPRYSNYGAGVLGEALARLTAQSYEQLVHERIVLPLGLTDTRVRPDGTEAGVAVGHTRRGRVTVDWQLPALAGAGALRSSVRDLLRFVQAHLDPPSTSLEAAVRAVVEPRAGIGRALGIGLGWHILDGRGRSPVWWHNGGTGGFRSFVGFDPAVGRGVAVLANDTRSVDRIGSVLLEPPRAA